MLLVCAHTLKTKLRHFSVLSFDQSFACVNFFFDYSILVREIKVVVESVFTFILSLSIFPFDDMLGQTREVQAIK